MNQDEILEAAKEAGCNDEFMKMAPCWLERFARIIERKTIERCAEKLLKIGALEDGDFIAAIRKLGEQ
jgi:hypothetical protein